MRLSRICDSRLKGTIVEEFEELAARWDDSVVNVVATVVVHLLRKVSVVCHDGERVGHSSGGGVCKPVQTPQLGSVGQVEIG